MTMRRLVAVPVGANFPPVEQQEVPGYIPVIELDDETGILYAAGKPLTGGGGGPELQVDGVPCAVQDLLNFISSASINAFDNGDGSIEFDSKAPPLTSTFGAPVSGDNHICSGSTSVQGGASATVNVPTPYGSSSHYIVLATPFSHPQGVSAVPISGSQFTLALGGSSPANDDVIAWFTVGISVPL
jgi:hypothetical protein